MAHHGAHGHTFDDERVAAALEVEGELAAGIAAEAIGLCADRLAAGGIAVRRVLDLGCGPGVGTAQLADAFPTAEVLAVDGSAAMLARAEARAARLGVAARVGTRRLDLDGDLRPLGTCDLAWAAMAIHHAEDEVAALRRLGALLEPHGLLCLLERADPIVVRLGDDLGRPGLWDRVEQAWSAWYERARPALPGAMADDRYPDMLAAAGLDVVLSRTAHDTVAPPGDDATRAFLASRLRGTVRQLGDLADPDDLDALRARLDAPPEDWKGASVTSSRRILVGRRAR